MRKIIIDTREQRPWSFDHIDKKIETIHRKLETGDYSLEGAEDFVCIERKSLNDFANTLSVGKSRFYKELRRMQQIARNGFACVIVEGSIQQILDHKYNGGISPGSVLGYSFDLTFGMNIPVIFCDNRSAAIAVAWRLLKRADSRLIEHFKDDNSDC